jgi:hypothetical protein
MTRTPTPRHVRRLATLAATAALLAGALLPRTAPAQRIDINTGLTPTNDVFGLTGIAWRLIPAQTITVNTLRTYFADVGANANVTFEIRGGDVNGAALRSVTFNSGVARGQLGGASFADITLAAGETYWLTFTDILGVGRNVNEAPPADATRLLVRVRRPNDNTFGPPVPANPNIASAPIIQLSAVPEPATTALLAGGLVMLGVAARARRRRPGVVAGA